MATQFDKFIATMKTVLMLDQADLDFGIYRIMNQKRDQIESYLNNDLRWQVTETIRENASNDAEAVKKELTQLVATLTAAGMNPDDAPKVKELKERIARCGNSEELENEVYSHLTIFFGRYYDGGDFISQRRYKKDVYAIPYEGEEVKLYWANADQYYIKTAEYFRNYRFAVNGDKFCEFTLREATTEQNNNVAQNNMERRFALCEETPVEVIGNTLHIYFTYELYPKATKQKRLIEAAYETVKDAIPAEFAAVLALRPTESDRTRTLLQKHLNTYVARNSFDFFIHKDLGGFLSRELDFYIKNEILVIDDINARTPDEFLKHLTVIKAIKMVGMKLITFLASLENYQKRLWLKKKFVVESNYCITLDRVPEKFYAEIAANDAQREEWMRLFAIDEITSQNTDGSFVAGKSRYSVPLTVEFLKENPFLVLDTKFFTAEFKNALLASIDHIDEQCDGLLINSENFQALELLQEKYRGCVKCVYIDPPYNTGDDDFAYKDCLKESSWLTFIENRLQSSRAFYQAGGTFAASIDINEIDHLTELLDKELGRINRKANITVRRASLTGAKVINPGPVNIGENVILYSNNVSKWQPQNAYRAKGYDNRYGAMIVNPQDDYSKWRFSTVLEEFAKYKGIQKSKLKKTLGNAYEEELLQYVIKKAEGVIRLAALDEYSIGSKAIEIKKESQKNPSRIYHLERTGANDYYVINGNAILFYKDRLKWMGDGLVPVEQISDIWDDVLPNDLHNEGGVQLKKGKKPEKLVNRIFECTTNEGDTILDYFAGSATSGAVALKSKRKFINIEANEYFDDIPLKRLKNTLHGDTSGVTNLYQWKGGGFFKYMRLEQYEDTLNNLTIEPTNISKDNVDFYGGYMLGYMLDIETRDSLFNMQWFRNPWNMKLRIIRQNETREENVDVIETFNYLIGLNVTSILHPKKGVCTVEGVTRRGERTLVIWRDCDTVDNDALNDFFRRMSYSTRDTEFDRIYVNGDNNLENLRTDEEQWKVVLTEQEFAKRMFEDC